MAVAPGVGEVKPAAPPVGHGAGLAVVEQAMGAVDAFSNVVEAQGDKGVLHREQGFDRLPDVVADRLWLAFHVFEPMPPANPGGR